MDFGPLPRRGARRTNPSAWLCPPAGAQRMPDGVDLHRTDVSRHQAAPLRTERSEPERRQAQAFARLQAETHERSHAEQLRIARIVARHRAQLDAVDPAAPAAADPRAGDADTEPQRDDDTLDGVGFDDSGNDIAAPPKRNRWPAWIVLVALIGVIASVLLHTALHGPR
jgi:hypothetical protein